MLDLIPSRIQCHPTFNKILEAHNVPEMLNLLF